MLHSRNLLTGLDPACLDRAREDLVAGRVHDLERLDMDGEQVLTADVHGDEPDPCRVYVRLVSGRVEGDCTCPEAFNCQHVAATVLRALEMDTEPATPPDQTPPRPPKDKYPPGIRHRLIYLLELDSDRQHVLVCTLKTLPEPGGELATATPFGLSRGRDANHPGYVLDVDVTLLRTLAARCERWDGVRYRLPEDGGALVRQMVETGRAYWSSIHAPPLMIGPARDARLVWELAPSGVQQAGFRDEAELVQLPFMPPWYVDAEANTVGPMASGLSAEALRLLQSLDRVQPDEAAAARATVASFNQETGAAIPLPHQVELITRPAREPLARLELMSFSNPRAGKDSRQPGWLTAARLEYLYGQDRLAWDAEGEFRLAGAPDDEAADEPLRVLQIPRSREQEKAFRDELAARGLTPDIPTDLATLSSPGDRFPASLWAPGRPTDEENVWPALEAALPTLRSRGWQIAYHDSYRYRQVNADQWELTAREATRPGWFELEMAVEVEGRSVPLLPLLSDWIEHFADPDRPGLLLDYPEDHTITVRIDEQRVLFMPVARLRHVLRMLTDLFDGSIPRIDKGLILPAARAGMLSAHQAGHWQLSAPERLARLADRLGDFRGVAEAPPPRGLKASLRAYQKAGLDWLQFLRDFELGGILADDMGLGKTVQTLAHLLLEKESGRANRPSLVVAPTSLMFNWRAEARRFAPDLKVLLLHGPKRAMNYHRIADADLVLTTYPLIQRDLKVLDHHDWHLLILDEAQQIKNPRTRAARAVREIRSRHRLCLTGTPMENHLGELWALMDFLMPGLLGNRQTFNKRFRTPIEKHGDEEAGDALARRIRPFFLRRTKTQVAPELPDKIDVLRTVALNDAQQTLYDTVRLAMQERVRRALADRGLDRSRIVVLDALLKLRQVCCHPGLLKNMDTGSAGSAKLDLLMDLLPPLIAEGRRVLLFSQFTSMLALIEKAVAERNIPFVKLTGQTRDRARPVNSFQEGRVPLFLISLKAGGSGLNLTAADTVIHYDPWWNPAVEDQATDRAHRIGQNQKVMVYRLITEGTVEEKILKMQHDKRGLLDGLFQPGPGGRLDSRDLEILFEPV